MYFDVISMLATHHQRHLNIVNRTLVRMFFELALHVAKTYHVVWPQNITHDTVCINTCMQYVF